MKRKQKKERAFLQAERNLILNKVLKEGNTEKMVFEQGHNRDEEDHNRLPREKVFQAQEAIIIKVQKKHASCAIRRAEQLVCLERKEQERKKQEMKSKSS